MAEDMVLDAWGTSAPLAPGDDDPPSYSLKSSLTEAREGPDPAMDTPPSRRRPRSEAENRGAGAWQDMYREQFEGGVFDDDGGGGGLQCRVHTAIHPSIRGCAVNSVQ
jgi:hypothetical protein